MGAGQALEQSRYFAAVERLPLRWRCQLHAEHDCPLRRNRHARRGKLPPHFEVQVAFQACLRSSGARSPHLQLKAKRSEPWTPAAPPPALGRQHIAVAAGCREQDPSDQLRDRRCDTWNDSTYAVSVTWPAPVRHALRHELGVWHDHRDALVGDEVVARAPISATSPIASAYLDAVPHFDRPFQAG